MLEVGEYFRQMPSMIRPEGTEGLHAVCQFVVTGNSGGEYHVVIDDGNVEALPGSADAPNITLTIRDEDFFDVVEGRIDSATALLSGKLRLQGDVAMAMRLQSLLNFG